ncbi:MAG: type II toxin-antitoxin system VapC family toxin [Nitrospirota bacterium]
MNYFYLDTSVLAKRYAKEEGTDKIDAIFDDENNIIVIGNIAITELYSALSKKCRINEITRQDFQIAILRFELDIAKGIFQFLQIDNQTIKASKILILNHRKLRAYDSLHLALALELYCLEPTILVSDQILLEACVLEGLKVLKI